ncbi:MAG: flagellar biosynthesis anti-sigma factor FlgM [Clostridiaceae bacterium]|jgi:flagellar biosynthesis anti-sigma factor FlgM|nr:flagellar biosynthesis anti-sigma factor FlgM [Clostridiaceae bacterium]
MKINPLSSYDAINKVNKNAEKSQITKTDMNVNDEVRISDQAKAIDKYIQKAKTSDIDRSELVNSLKNKVRSGNYKVDSKVLSEKIIESVVKK